MRVCESVLEGVDGNTLGCFCFKIFQILFNPLLDSLQKPTIQHYYYYGIIMDAMLDFPPLQLRFFWGGREEGQVTGHHPLAWQRVIPSRPLRLVHTSNGIGSGIGSGVGSSTESESEGSE